MTSQVRRGQRRNFFASSDGSDASIGGSARRVLIAMDASAHAVHE